MRQKPFKNVCIIGTGAFGTAIAQHIASLDNTVRPEVIIYGIEPRVTEELNEKHINTKYLPGIPLSPNITGTDSLEEATKKVDLIILGVPAQHIREAMKSLRHNLKNPCPILSLAKGIEKNTGKTISSVISEELPPGLRRKSFPLAALSGPSFARDIAVGHPVGITVGSKNRDLLNRLHAMLNTPLFDVKITTDIDGVQTGGALKNILGIVAGIFTGLKLGDSIFGDYLTRSLIEMREIGMFFGGRWMTFSGRAGLGDLAITCTPSSRNFRFGKTYAETFQKLREMDKESSIESIHEKTFNMTIEKMGTRTVEGYDTIEPIFAMVETNRIFTPIIRGVYRLLYTRDIAPEELLGHIRTMDLARKKEGLRIFSVVMHELFPRIWFRRH